MLAMPFERGATDGRRGGHFVAIEIQRDTSKVKEAFASLAEVERALDYAMTVPVVVDSAETLADQCPADIARKTVGGWPAGGTDAGMRLTSQPLARGIVTRRAATAFAGAMRRTEIRRMKAAE